MEVGGFRWYSKGYREETQMEKNKDQQETREWPRRILDEHLDRGRPRLKCTGKDLVGRGVKDKA